MKPRIVLFFAVIGLFACSKQSEVDENGLEPEAGIVTESPRAAAPGPGATEPPAVAGLTITPAEPLHGDTIRAVVESPEGEILYEFQWFVDGELVSGEYGEQLGGSWTRKGRRIQAEVQPSLRGVTGPAVRSPVVTVANTPPKISAIKVLSADDIVQLQVEADDPDEDTLTYRLDKGPSGMSIDASTGLISWKPPEGLSGSVEYAVIVSDGEREFMRSQTFRIESGGQGE